jgi:hypothetical protein
MLVWAVAMRRVVGCMMLLNFVGCGEPARTEGLRQDGVAVAEVDSCQLRNERETRRFCGAISANRRASRA